MEIQKELGKNTLLKAIQFAKTYRAPLIVFSVILGAVLIDYGFRSSGQDFYAKGLTAMRQQKYDEAVKLFSRALRQAPADPASRFGLGWAYHSKGWADEALKQYDMAAKSAAEPLYLSYFNSGVLLHQKRKLDEAATAYQNAVAVSPNASGAVFNLGFVYSDRGQNELALNQFLKTIKLEPKNVNAHYNAGLMAERLGRKEDAKKLYQSALGIDPQNAGSRDRLKALGG